MNHKEEGIIGSKFGFWTVLNRGKNRNQEPFYLCKCECGNEKEVKWKYLKNGVSKSCGCKTKDLKIKSLSKPPGEAAFSILYSRYRLNAKERGLLFSISKEKFREITSSNCYYCGTSPKGITKQNTQNGIYLYNGIDRFDNELGYIENNCVACCKNCNYMKKSLSYEDFIEHINRIYLYNNRK